MSKKINISIIGTRGYPHVYSGYETFVKQLSERLVHKDCNVTVYCHRGLFDTRPKEIKGIKKNNSNFFIVKNLLKYKKCKSNLFKMFRSS